VTRKEVRSAERRRPIGRTHATAPSAAASAFLETPSDLVHGAGVASPSAEEIEMRPIRASSGIALVVSAAAPCTVHGQATVGEPVGTVQVTSAPVVNWGTYPHTVYNGRTVYYINNRWGFPRRGGWTYFQSEPPELVRYRRRIETAPPAPRYVPPDVPPPAVQVR
jgi:hypothetical protein